MFVPFLCLVLAAFLPYLLSYVVLGQRVSQFGRFDNRYPRLEQARLEGLGARAHAASANAFETFPLFAAAVLGAMIVGIDPGVASLWSLVYLGARVVHAAFYLADLHVLRSLAFLVAAIALLVLYVVVLMALR